MALPKTGVRSQVRIHKAIGTYWLLSWLAVSLPRPLLMRVAAISGWVGPQVAKSQAQIVAAHLRKATGTKASSKQVRTAYSSYARYWFDAFRVASIGRVAAKTAMPVDGLTQIAAAREAGKGVILALPHMGNWDVAGAWVVANGIPLTVVVEALEPPEVFDWFVNFRSSIGLSVVANGPKVGAALLAALHRNEAIALLCDRDIDGTGGQYEFFGEVTSVPKGPATLALRSGAALLPVGVYEFGDKYRVDIQPPISAERTGKLSADVDRMTKELIAKFEELIARAPEQWHVFQPNWPSEH